MAVWPLHHHVLAAVLPSGGSVATRNVLAQSTV